MIVNGYEIKILCANKWCSKETVGHPEKNEYVYGDIYDVYEDCVSEHPDEDVMYGYFVDEGKDTTPDWFDDIEEAIAYAQSLPKRISRKSFTVPTPDGYFIAEQKGGLNDYPGVYVTHVQNGCEELISCTEYDSGRKALIIRNYREGEDEPVSVIRNDTEETI